MNAISTGPVTTRAASGLAEFDQLDKVKQRSPLPHSLTANDVGSLTAYLIADGGRAITGETIHIDSDYHISD